MLYCTAHYYTVHCRTTVLLPTLHELSSRSMWLPESRKALKPRVSPRRLSNVCIISLRVWSGCGLRIAVEPSGSKILANWMSGHVCERSAMSGEEKVREDNPGNSWSFSFTFAMPPIIFVQAGRLHFLLSCLPPFPCFESFWFWDIYFSASI